MFEETYQRQFVLIQLLQQFLNENSKEKWKVKAEYSTNDNDKRVCICQEQLGQKEVFYGNIEPLYNYYLIEIFGLSIAECKGLSLLIGSLIGNNFIMGDNKEKWELMFIQNMNPQFVEYKDIRRVGYEMTLQCVIKKIWKGE